jgi:hypothetical protein
MVHYRIHTKYQPLRSILCQFNQPLLYFREIRDGAPVRTWYLVGYGNSIVHLELKAYGITLLSLCVRVCLCIPYRC